MVSNVILGATAVLSLRVLFFEVSVTQPISILYTLCCIFRFFPLCSCCSRINVNQAVIVHQDLSNVEEMMAIHGGSSSGILFWNSI